MDMWADWLIGGRFGGDTDAEQRVRAAVDTYLDHVLDGAALTPGDTLLDIGSGEGVVGWRAFEMVPDIAGVIMADISAPMLAHARALAAAHGVAARCQFLNCAADALAVADASVDAVTTRSVLAYVADKPAALREIFRVLRPGGRMSLGEPLFRESALEAVAARMAAAQSPDDAFLPLLARWKGAQFPDSQGAMAANPLTNYAERDFLRLAQQAGFTTVNLVMRMSSGPAPAEPWSVFAARQPHPLAPSLADIMKTQFSSTEQARFEAALRPLVECGALTTTTRMMYVSAVKPTR